MVYSGHFCRPGVKLKKARRCSVSLADSAAVGKVAIPAQLIVMTLLTGHTDDEMGPGLGQLWLANIDARDQLQISQEKKNLP